MIRFVVVVVRQ